MSRTVGNVQTTLEVFDAIGEFLSREAYWHAFDGREGSTFDYLSLLTDERRLRASLLPTMDP